MFPPDSQLSCFIPTLDEEGGRCVDPVPILNPTGTKSVERCFSPSDCNLAGNTEEMECIRLSTNTHLLRITVLPPIWERVRHGSNATSKTVLWSGPREEVWDQGLWH